MERDASFGRLLHRLRKQRDLTQEALAQQAYCAVDTIKKIEAGVRRPSRQLAAQFADCLGLTDDERPTFLAAARANFAGAAELQPSTTATIGSESASTTTRPHNNLPAQPTALLGRARELTHIGALLHRADVRLVTLTGPGGVGKTRLATEVAAELFDTFADGVSFVRLAPISDPTLVITAIAQALGVRETGDQRLVEVLHAYLRDKQVLLLLDNFEQVLGAGALIADLLAAAPRVKAIVTSRSTLHISGEYEFAVPPLALPDLAQLPPPAELARYAAVELFVQRAQASKSDFALLVANAPAIAAICARLDGLPLAIELAAARSKLFAPPALLKRLDRRLVLLKDGPHDLPPRHQTLRGAIAWSYDLLSDDQQRLFRQLGVFVGGCTLEAIAAVCNAGGDLAIDVVDGVAALLDQSLLRSAVAADAEPRFSMLETIREYALEQQALQGEDALLRQFHAAYYLNMAEQAVAELKGPQPGLWLDRLEHEHDNLRAAMRWYSEEGDAEHGLRLGAALGLFWVLRGHVTEGRVWLADLFAVARTQSGLGLNTPVRAKALLAAGRLAGWQDDVDQARNLLEEGLAIARVLQDQRQIVDVLDELRELVAGHGTEERRKLAEDSLALRRAIGDTHGSAWVLFDIGKIARDLSDDAAAAVHYSESLAIFRAFGDARGQAWVLNSMGVAARLQGDDALAAAYYDESLALHRAVGDLQGSACVLANQGYLALRHGDSVSAAACFKESLEHWSATGSTPGIALGLAGFGGVAVAKHQPERAARLLGAAAAVFERFHYQPERMDRAEIDQDIAAARAQLGEAAFAAAWAAGRALSLEQAVAEALDEGE